MTVLIDPELTEQETALFHFIYSKAAQMLQRDGELQPVAFFRVGSKPTMKGPQPKMIVPVKMDMPGNDQGKDALAETLRHITKQLDADLVLMILESWMVKPNEEETDYIQKHGEWKVRPSQHPDRIEIVFFTVSKPTGESWSAWAEITRDANNKPSIPLEPPKLEFLKAGGRFGNLFENGIEGGETDGPASTTSFTA